MPSHSNKNKQLAYHYSPSTLYSKLRPRSEYTPNIMKLSIITMMLLASTTLAFWRMPCARSGLARVDPVVNRGGLAAHAHSIHGSSGMSSLLLLYHELDIKYYIWSM